MSKEDDEEMPEWVDEAAPKWGDAGKSEDAYSDVSWMMMRMTSHFLNIVQPKLEERVSKYAHEYHTEAMKSDDFTIRQHDMYEDYVSIFESHMEVFQSEYSKIEFIDSLKIASLENSDGKDTMGSIFIAMLDNLSDFREFDMMMKEYWEEHKPTGHK
jgi:hypothetical protein